MALEMKVNDNSPTSSPMIQSITPPTLQPSTNEKTKISRVSKNTNALGGIPLPGLAVRGIESQLLRAPPLPLKDGQDVIVINGDKSSLTWKKYKLKLKNEESNICVVVGADNLERQFPRSVVKPGDYIKNFKKFYKTLGDDLEFYQFWVAMKLLGANYTHTTALKIFQSLDINANGVLLFKQFINWVYGLGRQADRGKLLTTLECVIGSRPFEENLPYYIMEMKQNALKQLTSSWCKAKLNVAASNNDQVTLTSIEGDEMKVQIPSNLKEFDKQYTLKLKDYQQIPKFIPCKNDQRELSVIVMGGPGVGKSALLNKFVKSIFPHEYDPTIQDTYRKQILVDEKPALLDILDTAGQVEFATMRYDWLRDGVDVLTICFTRASRKSFDQCQEHLLAAQRLLKQMNPPRIVPVILVGTKIDLESEFEVAQSEIDEICKELNGEQDDSLFIKYVECSALTDYNIENVFKNIIIMYRGWRDEKTSVKVDKVIRSKSIMDRERVESASTTSEEFGPRNRMAEVNDINPKFQKVTNQCMQCLKWSTQCCPNLSKYFDVQDEGRLLIIGRVPKDKFPDDLAPPVFSVQHFIVQRTFYFKRFFGAIFCAIFFPLFLAFQSLIFLIYSERTSGVAKVYSDKNDYTDPQTQIIYDYLSPIVGRDPRDDIKQTDTRKWFLSQTNSQKLARLILAPLICVLFGCAWYNASIYISNDRYNTLIDGNRENDSYAISVMEYLGPLQLWLVTWLILAFYVALDIHIIPGVPNMQELRPFVLYFGNDESLRTTAYVFLRGFAKSTLEIYRLEATSERIITALFISIIYSLIPGITRQVVGEYAFWSHEFIIQAILAFIINLLLTFILVLTLQMQLMSGLQNYIEWMQDVTSLLDAEFAEERRLPYLNLSRQNNSLSWIEMRTYLYTKGLIIFGRQEIFVGALIFLLILSAMYILYRLLISSGPVYKSETFNGLFFIFLILCYALLRMLRYTRVIEKLQVKQISLLAKQKFKVYYKRVTYHPPNVEEEGNEEDEDEFGLLPRIPSEFNDEEFSKSSIKTSQKKTNAKITNPSTAATGGGGDTIAVVSIHNPNYFRDCETLLENIIALIKSQDIIPRIFNINMHTLVGFTTLGAIFAVIPTAIKTAMGEDCDWDQ